MTASRVGLGKSCGSTTALYLQHGGRPLRRTAAHASPKVRLRFRHLTRDTG